MTIQNRQSMAGTDVPLSVQRETWIPLGTLSRKIGIHPDTIRSAIRKASRRGETWVKKESDPEGCASHKFWWINTDNSHYQQLLTHWQERANNLTTQVAFTPLTRRRSALQAGSPVSALLPGIASGSTLVGVYLASQGLEIFVNALKDAQDSGWSWRWGDDHGEGCESFEEALIAALHSKLGHVLVNPSMRIALPE